MNHPNQLGGGGIVHVVKPSNTESVTISYQVYVNLFIGIAIPPVVPELFSDDDATHFDDIPEPDSGEEFFPTPKVRCILYFLE